MDKGSFIYIIITIAILVISGMGNRRKKQAQQLKAEQMRKQKAMQLREEQMRQQQAGRSRSPKETAAGQAKAAQRSSATYKAREEPVEEPYEPMEDEFENEYKIPGSRLFGDQFRDLTRSLGQQPQSPAGSPFDRLEQFLTGQSPRPQPRPSEMSTAEAMSMEGESMEETMDEEEQILEEIRKRRESVDSVETKDNEISEYFYDEIKDVEETVVTGLPVLFEDADEIKKAVIYSEIFKPKYF